MESNVIFLNRHLHSTPMQLEAAFSITQTYMEYSSSKYFIRFHCEIFLCKLVLVFFHLRSLFSTECHGVHCMQHMKYQQIASVYRFQINIYESRTKEALPSMNNHEVVIQKEMNKVARSKRRQLQTQAEPIGDQ